MSAHTKEPWHAGSGAVEADDGTLICTLSGWRNDQVNKENGNRIVACVNACAGMDDPDAYIRHIEKGSRLHYEQAMKNGQLASEYKQQRDELMKALKEAKYLIKGREHTGFIDSIIAEIEASK